jgi:hypothetical protein
MQNDKPTRVGWWWVRSADGRAVDGWLPVWVCHEPGWLDGALGFHESCRGGWVSVNGYMWGGPVVRSEVGRG